MAESKWVKYDKEIEDLLKIKNTRSPSEIAREIAPHLDTTDIDLLRTYIKRKTKKRSVIDETLHRGNLQGWDCKVAWVKNTETGVSALVTNPDYKDSQAVSYERIRDEMVSELKSFSPIVGEYKRTPTKDPHCLILDIADLHIGKLVTTYGTGTEYNVDIAVKRALEASESLINKSEPYNLDKIYFIIGNDVLHTDNPKRTTTAGTPQDTDGMWYDNFKVARKVYTEIIARLSTIAPVHIVHCPSNHDNMSGFMLADAVYCFFYNNENITFDISLMHRKYTKYGLNFLGFSHGEGAKLEQVPLLAANEAPKLWAETEFRYTFLHHVHHKQYWKFKSGVDFIGMTVEYLRSPSESDIWHSREGFTGSKVSIEAFIHHPTQGQVSRLSYNF